MTSLLDSIKDGLCLQSVMSLYWFAAKNILSKCELIGEIFTYPIAVPILGNLPPRCTMTYMGPPGEGGSFYK